MMKTLWCRIVHWRAHLILSAVHYTFTWECQKCGRRWKTDEQT